jgi:hypothetical protein
MRRRYTRKLTCPECGLSEFFQAQDATGTRHHACVDCFALDGVVVEPAWVLATVSEPRTRNARLCGKALPSPLRKTRSR